jgi:hypothetical protein
MDLNATLIKELLFTNLIIMLFYSVKFSIGKVTNIYLIAGYSVLFSLYFFH